MKKKILVLAPTNYEFYKDIVLELKQKGYNVTLIEDRTFRFDHLNFPHNKFMSFLKTIIAIFYRPKKKYWQTNNNNHQDAKYDYFLCFNAMSLHPLLIKRITTANPNIKKILYLWDSCKCYRYNSYFKFFDKILTFDPLDAASFNIEYLPMYWTPSDPENKVNIENPMIFFVGTIHSDRFYIINELTRQLKELGIDNYMKIYVYNTQSFIFKCRYFLNKALKQENLIVQHYELLKGIRTSDSVIFEPLSLKEFNRQLSLSTHIIDIEQPIQSGISPRVIQAMSAGKKIISTNKGLSTSNYFDKNNIFIIERKRPLLEKSYFDNITVVKKDLLHLRIDNWIQTILE